MNQASKYLDGLLVRELSISVERRKVDVCLRVLVMWCVVCHCDTIREQTYQMQSFVTSSSFWGGNVNNTDNVFYLCRTIEYV